MANERQQLLQELRSILNTFIKNREELIRFLREAATELDGHHKKVKIAEIALMFGLSLTGPLSVNFALSASSSVAGAIENILNKSYIDKLDKLSQVDEESYLKFNSYLERYDEELRNNASNNNISCEIKGNISNQISILADVECSLVHVTQAASTAARSIEVVGATLPDSGMISRSPLIIDLAMNRHVPRAKQLSKKAAEFRQLAQNLTTQMKNVTQRITEIIDQHEQQRQQQQQNYQDNRQTSTSNSMTAIFSPFFLIIIFLIIIKNITNWIF